MFQTPQHIVSKHGVMASPHQQMKSTVKAFQPQQLPQQRKVIENFSFAINDEVGKGFSSKVYKGRNDQTGEDVAVKVIEMRLLKTPLHHSLLRSEIESLRMVKSDNVINLFQVYQTQNNTYIFTEYCDGGDLGNKLQKEGKLSEITVANLMMGIVNGYKAMKSMGVVHRDLKPANILLSADGVPKIADFGFATNPQSRPSMPNVNVGSPLYMSPQALSQSKYSDKSDIWAIGVSAYELLFGSVPWHACSEKELAQKMQSQPVSFPSGVTLSEECKNFIKICLIVDESKRTTVDELEAHPWLRRRQSQDRAQQSAKKAQYQPIIQVKQLSISKPFKQQTLGVNNTLPNTTSVCNTHPGKENTQGKKQQSIQEEVAARRSQGNVKGIYDQRKSSISMLTEGDYISERSSTDLYKIYRKNDLIILGQINFCRFLFRVVQLLEKNKNDIFKEKLMFLVLKHLLNKMDRLNTLPIQDTLNLPHYKTYTQHESFKQLGIAIVQYDQKYSLQFTSLWLTLFSQAELKSKLQKELGLVLFSNNFQCDAVTEDMLESRLLDELKVTIRTLEKQTGGQIDVLEDGEYVPSSEEQSLVLIDYLITYMQLVNMFQPREYQTFSQKSHIEQIAQGKPVRLTFAHYNEIKRKINGLL